MARLGYIDKIQDPTSNSDYYEIVDSVAREQLAFKTEKKYENSLPAKPTSKETWDEVKKYIYFIPIDGATGDDIYEEWTLFFIGDPDDASDYTDPDNYRYEKIGTTATDISNFSTKGHTHEVITEVEVEDHNYTPQGTVDSTFTGNENTTDTYTHNHSYKPEGQVSSTFTGNPSTTTDSSTTGVSLNKSSKKLSTKKLKLESASVSLSPSTTTVAKNTFAANSGSYEADKSIFNGISVTDGVLSFVTKKLDTATSVTGMTGSTTATKVTFGGNTTTEEDVATGAVESGSQLLGNDTGITDSGHTHTVTPLGSVSSTFTGSDLTTNNDSHSHAVTPTGTITSSFNGLRANLKHKVDNKKVRTSPDQEDEGSHAFEWYGIEFDEDGADPIKTRVGNMDMHRMLPIQTKMRRCLLNDDGTVNYYLDDNDSTKRAGSQEGWVTSEETFMSRVETDDIRDNNELIEAVKGNSIAWNQLAQNGGFVETINPWLSMNGTIAVSNNVLTYTITNPDDTVSIYQYNVPHNLGHKYLFSAELNFSVSPGRSGQYIGMAGYWGVTNNSVTPSANTWMKLSGIAEDNGTTQFETLSIYLRTNKMSEGDTVKVRNVKMIDITLMGIDNLTTVNEVEAWLADNVGTRDYYPYNEGALINNIMTGVKTTFDGGSNTYPFDVTKIYGQLNGIGEYVQVFPNGMKKADYAGTVRDMLYVDNGVIKAVVNVGDVDLGTLNYTEQNSTNNRQGWYAQISNAYISVLNSAPKAISPKFISQVQNVTWKSGDMVYYAGNGYLFFVNASQYLNADAFKSAMNGVHLNYEVATPLSYTNLVYRDNGTDTPLENVFFPNGINVGKNGTVEILPQNTTDVVTCAPTLSVRKYMLQANARLDGSDGQVMVEIPEHWRKVYTYLNGSKTRVRGIVSPYPQETSGWIHVKKGYKSAYEASIIAGKLCSISNIVDLTIALQDGKIVASCDVSTATGQSDITSQLPTTSQTMDTFRTAARARALDGGAEWNQLVYEQYLAVVWLYWIEYANLNSQDAFTNAKTVEGFMQGGLGNGVSTISSSNWSSFNGYRPFVPCGITNCLGNHSGEVYLTLPSGLGGGTVAVPSYRGIENFFGHIWKFADGIKYIGDGTQQDVRRCDNPANYSSEASTTNYPSIGNNYGGSGWKKKIMIGDDGDINCKEVGGSSNQAYCDYNYEAHSNGTYYCCLFGGCAVDGASAGLACVDSSNGGELSRMTIGSRLSYFEK